MTVKAAALAAAATLLAFGLWVSLCYTFGAWRADPDIYVTVQIWKGVREFGLGFVPTWAYTQDNWLLSLVPLTSLLFEAVGAGPISAVLPGWFVFVSSVAMTAALAWRLAGRPAAVCLACVLIFAGFPALGGAGFFSYPISHNISMAWALLTLILALRAVQRVAVAPAVAATVCVFVNSLSDPWAAAAIAGPLAAVSAALAWRHRATPLRRVFLTLAIGTAVAVLLAQTRVFGLLSFLPRSHFQLADLATMRLNIGWAQRSLGHIFNIFPGANLDAPLPRVAAAAAAVVLVGLAILAAALSLPRANPGRQLVAAVAMLSIVGVSLLYVVGRFPPSLAVGRFLPQIYYLGALLVVLAAADGWSRWPRLLKAALGLYAILFVLAGLFSMPQLWLRPTRPAPPPEAVEIAETLRARGLHYGYGVFWGAHSLLIDSVSDGAVTVRPVSLMSGRVRRRPAETSSLWYRPEAEPKGDPRRFLVIVNDGEECPDVEACVSIAQAQFGPASERIDQSGRVILVWPQSIAARIDTF